MCFAVDYGGIILSKYNLCIAYWDGTQWKCDNPTSGITDLLPYHQSLMIIIPSQATTNATVTNQQGYFSKMNKYCGMTNHLTEFAVLNRPDNNTSSAFSMIGVMHFPISIITILRYTSCDSTHNHEINND